MMMRQMGHDDLDSLVWRPYAFCKKAQRFALLVPAQDSSAKARGRYVQVSHPLLYGACPDGDAAQPVYGSGD
jgi:hypothetical protein